MSRLQLTYNRISAEIADFIFDNPVAVKDIRTLVRGNKAFWIIFGYALILSAGLAAVVFVITANKSALGHALQNLGIGYLLFVILTFAQAILIPLLIPSLSGGGLMSDYVQKRLEDLCLTPLTPAKILAGKMASTMLASFALLGCSLPLSGVCFLMGGISPLEIAVTYVMLMGWVFLMSAIFVSLSILSYPKAMETGKLLPAGMHALFTYTVYFAASFCIAIGTMPLTVVDIVSNRWSSAFSGISGLTVAIHPVEMAPVFFFHVSIAVVGLLAQIGVGTLILTHAAIKFPYNSHYTKIAFTRFLTAVLSLIGIFTFFGNTALKYNGFGFRSINSLLGATLIALTIIVIFTSRCYITSLADWDTVRFRKPLSRMIHYCLHGFTTQAEFWFSIFLWIAGCGIIALSLLLLYFTPASIGVMSIPDWVSFAKAAAAVLSAVIAILSVKILAGTWPNCSVGFMAGFITTTCFLLPISIRLLADCSGYHPLKYCIYPLFLFDPTLIPSYMHNEEHFTEIIRYLFIPEKHLWLACTAVWGIIAVIALYITSRRVSRLKGVA
ncbi:MAG: hypothetical protein ABFD64_04335 [Armatimonadota bacterium]